MSASCLLGSCHKGVGGGVPERLTDEARQEIVEQSTGDWRQWDRGGGSAIVETVVEGVAQLKVMVNEYFRELEDAVNILREKISWRRR